MAAVTIVGKNTKIPANDSSPEAASYRKDVARKLVRENPDDRSEIYRPDGGISKQKLTAVASAIASEIRDNRTIMELLPDTKAIFTLMISTIKSPNTLIGSKLQWGPIEKPAGIDWEGDPSAIIQDWLDDKYHFDAKLSEILWNCFCWRGSHPILVLPESSIDAIINQDQTLVGESFATTAELNATLPYNLDGEITKVTNIGIVADSTLATPNLDSLETVDDYFKIALPKLFTVTDNIEIFHRPKVLMELSRRRLREATKSYRSRQNNIIGEYMSKKKEGKGETIPNALDAKEVFHSRQYKPRDLLTVTGTMPKDRSTGSGLVLDLPSESVIPMGLVSIVLLDGFGDPLSIDTCTSEYDSLKRGVDLGSPSGLGGGLVKTVRDNYAGTKDNVGLTGNRTLKDLTEMYGKVFDQYVRDILTGSSVAGNVEEMQLPDMERVHLIGLTRALKGQRTTIMVVPSDLITYFHYEKNELGIGISLLSKYKFLASQRITLRLANLLARVTNSVPRKEVLMHIDEDEREAEQVFEMMKTSCIDDMQNEYSIGKIDSRDIVTNFVRANTTIRGVHPDLPTHHMEVKDYTRALPEVDSKLDEELKADWCKALDTQPTLVDEFFKPEFAIEQITCNTMYTKSIIEKQVKIEPQITEHVRQLCYAMPQLYRRLKDGIKIKSKGEYTEDDVLTYIIESISITLPRPEQAEIETTFESYSNVSKYIIAAVEAIIDEDMVYRLMDGELVNSDSIKALRSQIEKLCLREFLVSGTTNTIRRLLEGGEEGEKGCDVSAMLKEHNETLINNLGDMAKDIIVRSTKLDDKLRQTRDDLLKELEELAAKKAALEEAANGGDTSEDTPPDDTTSSDEDGGNDEWGIGDLGGEPDGEGGDINTPPDTSEDDTSEDEKPTDEEEEDEEDKDKDKEEDNEEEEENTDEEVGGKNPWENITE